MSSPGKCLIAFAVLMAFMLFGEQFLEVLHLSDEALSVAGGVILLLIAIDMVFPHRGQRGRPWPSPGSRSSCPWPSRSFPALPPWPRCCSCPAAHPGRLLEWAVRHT